jgi:hypothetical protein
MDSEFFDRISQRNPIGGWYGIEFRLRIGVRHYTPCHYNTDDIII